MLGPQVPPDPLGEELLPLTCTTAERCWLQGQTDALRWAKVFFSVKEAIFKAYYPLHGVFLDFLDAETRLDINAGAFVARLRSADGRLTAEAAGRFVRDAKRVVAFVAVGP